MSRQYIKKNLRYWDSLSNPPPVSEPQQVVAKTPDLPALENISFIEGSTDTNVAFTRTSTAGSFGVVRGAAQQFPLIDSLSIPFENNKGFVCATKAIDLCQKAYFNIAYFRNTIEALTEFSNTKIHVKCKNKTVKDFTEKWLEKIDVNSLQDQFYRGYYREGNVFIYRFDGRFDKKDLARMESAFGATQGSLTEEIPIQYVILNPINLGVQTGIFLPGSYVKIFSQFELARLKSPQTDIEKQIFNNLPEEVQNQIKGATRASFVLMTLDPERLSFSFYCKQSFEPMGIPFGYSVLPDMEQKLALKKMDMVLAKTIENIILLITTGDEPSKGGVNVENIKAIQNLFKNPAAARVLVSDHTTNAKYVIPDLEKVMGPEKYAVVNQDIREGLQNFLIGGDSKFGDTIIKAKIFIERLKKGQDEFDKFLKVQIRKMCDAMGFKNLPVTRREKVKLEDPNIANKVVTRLLELGVLTPPDGMETMETGLFPDEETNLEHQAEYKKQRDKGLFLPLIGGSTTLAQKEAGRPGGSTGTKKTTNRVGVRKASIDDYVKVLKSSEKLFHESAKKLSEIMGGALNDEQYNLSVDIAKSVIFNHPLDKWQELLAECHKNQDGAPSSEMEKEINSLSAEMELEPYSAALLYHAEKISSQD